MVKIKECHKMIMFHILRSYILYKTGVHLAFRFACKKKIAHLNLKMEENSKKKENYQHEATLIFLFVVETEL